MRILDEIIVLFFSILATVSQFFFFFFNCNRQGKEKMLMGGFVPFSDSALSGWTE